MIIRSLITNAGRCIFAVLIYISSIEAFALHEGPYDLDFDAIAQIGQTEYIVSLHVFGETFDPWEDFEDDAEWRFLGGQIDLAFFPPELSIDILNDLTLLDIVFPTYSLTEVNGEGVYAFIPTNVSLSGLIANGAFTGQHIQLSTIPIPDALWLFSSGIFFIATLCRKRR